MKLFGKTAPPAEGQSLRSWVLCSASRLACLSASVSAPVLSAQICRSTSSVARELIMPLAPPRHIPAFTQAWLPPVSSPLPVLVSAAFSAVVLSVGLYSIFSVRLSRSASSAILTAICCCAFSVSLAAMASTMMAVVLPFLPPSKV